MKNLLILNFSIRRHGNCWIASDVFSRKAAGEDIRVETVSVPGLKLKNCTGCFGCNNSELKCVTQDDLEGLKEKLLAADAIALFSPCFIFSAPASMKAIMERLAAWALYEIETGGKRRVGVSISMAGAAGEWHSMQRSFPALFLKLMNCDVAFLKTYENMGLKGEILLNPLALKEIEQVSESVRASLSSQKAVFPSGSEDGRLMYCPDCGNDAFRVYDHKTFVCAVCGKTLQQGAFGIHEIKSPEKMSPVGAKEHSEMIGGKIEAGYGGIDEIARRLEAYLSTGAFDSTEYHPGTDTEAPATAAVEWAADGLEEFKQAVPKGFQPFVKKAIERKASERGIALITKEVFLEFKKAFGN